MTDEKIAEREALLRECADAVEAILRAKRDGTVGGEALVTVRESAWKEAEQRLREWEVANNWAPPR